MDVSKYSILYWIKKYKLRTEKGDVLEWKDRLFLLDILSDWNPNIVVKKCAQIGGSIIFNLKVLFSIKTFGWNIIYTFPTDDDTREFVSSKTNKLLQANPQVFSGLPTDNIERKEINGRFLFFKGTVSKTAAIMTSADVLVHDEADRSDQKMLETYKSRTKASDYKGRWIFSNPTTEKGVVDNQWQKSDKKEWCITCPSCQLEQYLQFPDNLDMEKEIYICSSCKGEITDDNRRKGRWVAQNEGAEVSGYHISLLMAPWIKAKEIIEDSKGDQEYFYNFVLGEPYNPGDLSVSRKTILDVWTPKNLVTQDYYLGIDVGNICHYVLGSEKGIIKIGKFSDRSFVDKLMKQYKPTLVIDAMPDTNLSRYCVDTFRGAYMSYFKENSDNPRTLVWWGKGNEENDKKGIVYSNRNRMLDQLIEKILVAEVLFGVPTDNEFREFIKHWETLRRIKVVSNRGIESYEWDSTTGVDHYCFATLYWYLATLGKASGSLLLTDDEPVESIKQVEHGVFVNNLKEMLEEREYEL